MRSAKGSILLMKLSVYIIKQLKGQIFKELNPRQFYVYLG